MGEGQLLKGGLRGISRDHEFLGPTAAIGPGLFHSGQEGVPGSGLLVTSLRMLFAALRAEDTGVLSL